MDRTHEGAPVSVVVLTLNEEQNIEYCLQSVYGWSGDVHVVDSCSKDNTIGIARRYTEHIYQAPEDHWANIRNWALTTLPLKYGWVLFLDADERLTDELRKEITETLSRNPRENGFYIKREFIFLGKWLKHGGLYTSVLRLFRKDHVKYVKFGDSEYAVVKKPVGFLKHNMIHEDRKGISRWIYKHLRNAEREAKRILEDREDFPSFGDDFEIEGRARVYARTRIWEKIPLALRPFLLFAYCYFFRLGFLDGVEGLTYLLLWALWYRLLIYIKVREIQRK